MEIPLTLAIIDGLLIQIDEANYVIPLSQVEVCLENTTVNDECHGTGFLMPYRGKMLPVIRLRDVFSAHKSPLPDIQQIVVINWQSKTLGLLVDKVVGDHQTVIKNLGRMYRSAEGVSGATILGDGTVALILDVAAIIDSFERLKKHNP